MTTHRTSLWQFERDDVEIEIEYEIVGRHLHPTRENPGEWPEVEIVSYDGCTPAEFQKYKDEIVAEIEDGLF